MTGVERASLAAGLLLVFSLPPEVVAGILILALLAGVTAGIWQDLTPLWRGEPAPAEDGDPHRSEKAPSDA